MSAARDTLPERLILIIEDDGPIADALALIVEDLGYTPLIAADGLAGLDLARNRQPMLILTDLMLPKLTGQQVIAHLRIDQATQGKTVPPIVVVTAGSKHQAREAGGDAFILKPFELETVETTLQRLLGEEHHIH
jgi:CheY-like chemotaxis protein